MKIILMFLLLLCEITVFAVVPRPKVMGVVYDAKTGETLPGATIYVKSSMDGVVSSLDGTFALTVDENETVLVISYVGYETIEMTATVGTKCEVKLYSSSQSLQEVTVTASNMEDKLSNTTMGVEKMSAMEIKRMPALLGEVDVIKAIQMLPGVLPTSEGGSGYSVRGGSADQNLVLLDNAVVYNPSHLLGFFSTFNNDVIGEVALYKGDLPLKHGGRLSSLLDVQTKVDRPKRLTGTGGIGLLSTRATIEAPIGEKTSVMVGGRRSYLDLFMKMSSDESISKSSLFFYDFNAKITHQLSPKDHLSLSGYYGKDRFKMDYGVFEYGNGTLSLMWNHIYSDKLSSRVTFSLSDYAYDMEAEMGKTTMGIEATMTDYALRADFLQLLTEDWRIEYGASAAWHTIQPGTAWMTGMNTYNVQKNKALESGAFISSEHKIGEKINIRYGVRFSAFQNVGSKLVYKYDENYKICDSTYYSGGEFYKTYTNIEPRIGVVYHIDNMSSVKANFARNVQYMQLANNSASGSPIDIWFPASPNIRPQTSDMYSVGYFRNMSAWDASVEVYYKHQRNVVDFADHADLMLNERLEGEVRTGTGRAYGMEFSVHKTKGRLTGFASYTLSRSERKVETVNDNKYYLAPYDKTHSINISATYEISKKHMLSASWMYATGNPTTYPTGRFQVGEEYYPIYSGRNEYRKPDYHRLDLSWTYVPNPDSKKRWKGEWNFSLFNAYGKKNPWIIQYQQDNGGTPYAEMTYLFSIVPSVTYNFRF